MKKQVLTIKQMQRLKELGVDTSKASCSYDIHKTTNAFELLWGFEEDSNDVMFDTIPTFTLQDILDLLPHRVGEELVLFIDKSEKAWRIGYTDIDSEEIFEDFKSENFIDAAYTMLCWCAENEYIKINKQ